MHKKLLSSLLFVALLVTGCNKSNGNGGSSDPDPVDPVVTYFPIDEVKEFLTNRGADVSNFEFVYSSTDEVNLLSANEVEEEPPYFEVVLEDDNSETYIATYNALVNDYYWSVEEHYLVDPTSEVALILLNDNNFTMKFYAYNDIQDVPDPVDPDPEELSILEFPLQDAGYIAKETDLNGKSYTFSEFTFSFKKNSGSTTPKSEKSNYVALYQDNSMAISSKYQIKKIELATGERSGELTVDCGSVTQNDSKVSWTGDSKSITFTASAQYRFTNVTVYYVDEPDTPIVGGEKTIAEVKELASQIEYSPSVDGWYLSNTYVTVQIKAIDAIDSTSTSGTLDGNARGKVLCVDETGYIICSSGVSKNNPIDFYQRVKDYIKAGTTTYEVSGYIAFLNDVIEIKVDAYEYKSDLVINYDLDNFVKNGIDNSDTLMSDSKSIKTNPKGYGVGNIVRLNNLTYFNKYNDAGSYYFLDEESKLVNAYSLLDKDRNSLQEGKVYNIIGVESLYLGRPSLRILEVETSTADPSSFDFTNAINKTETSYFYNVNNENSAYMDEFYHSSVTIYSMDVYVSRFTDEKYTINNDYYFDSNFNEYTTGSSQVNAANFNSLGLFNEDLTYNQVLLDFLLENCTSEEECENVKLTLYFTLAFLDKVNGKYMWRVNIFEDLVFSLDYYNSEQQILACNSEESTWTHDDSVQSFTSGDLSVTNASTELNDMSYHPSYLKIMDGTSLTISFYQPILGFTLYHATYSYIAGFGNLNIKAYRQFKEYTVVLLASPSAEVAIDHLMIGGNRTNAFLHVDSIAVNY